MKNLKRVKIPDSYNYIAVFLTLHCEVGCSYCINLHNKGQERSSKDFLSTKKWIEGLNRLESREGLPITLQGGEPGLHPGFIQIINNLREDLEIDILTNLSFNVDEFITKVNPSKLNRESPYPNIRASYHPLSMNLKAIVSKALKLMEAGFSVGVYGLLHPEFEEEILKAKKKCLNLGIDFRTKEFLGEYKGKLYGTYRYPGAINAKERKNCLCRVSELIIGPNCDIYKCHHDLYKDFSPMDSLLNPDFEIEDRFRKCNQFGDCNPCDVKVKTNRFQVYGHTSVEIKDVYERS